MSWQSTDTVPANTKVIVFYRSQLGMGRTVMAKRVSEKTLEAAGEYTEDWGEYDEDRDAYFCPAGWYEVNENHDDYSLFPMEIAPTHWMPLPAPPSI